MHLVVDAEEGEDVEKLMAMAHDVEEPRLDPLGDFADVEEGGHQQPEVAAVEVDEERGVACAEVEEDALQHDGAGHAERHGEHEGAHGEGVGAARGAAAAAGGRAAHGQRQRHGQHEHAVGRDGQAAVQLPAQPLLHVAAHGAGVQQAQPRQQVVGVGHGAGEAVVADGGVVQVEEGGAEARGEAAEEVGRAAHGEGEQHPRGVAPEGQQGRVVEGHVPGAPQQKQPPEAAEEEQQWDEVGPEVEGLVGGLQHRGQALLCRAVQTPVARKDEALHEVLGHLVPPQQGSRARRRRRRLLLVPIARRHAAAAPAGPGPAASPPTGRGRAAAPAAAGGGSAVALRLSAPAAAPGSITHCSRGSGSTAAAPPAPPPGIAVTGDRRRIQRSRGAGRDAPAAPGRVSRRGRRWTPEPPLMIDAAAAGGRVRESPRSEARGRSGPRGAPSRGQGHRHRHCPVRGLPAGLFCCKRHKGGAPGCPPSPERGCAGREPREKGDGPAGLGDPQRRHRAGKYPQAGDGWQLSGGLSCVLR